MMRRRKCSERVEGFIQVLWMKLINELSAGVCRSGGICDDNSLSITKIPQKAQHIN